MKMEIKFFILAIGMALLTSLYTFHSCEIGKKCNLTLVRYKSMIAIYISISLHRERRYNNGHHRAFARKGFNLHTCGFYDGSQNTINR